MVDDTRVQVLDQRLGKLLAEPKGKPRAAGKVAAEWKSELTTLLPDTLPKMAGERFVKLLEGKYGAYLCLPGFAILTAVTLFNWLSRWSGAGCRIKCG